MIFPVKNSLIPGIHTDRSQVPLPAHRPNVACVAGVATTQFHVSHQVWASVTSYTCSLPWQVAVSVRVGVTVMCRGIVWAFLEQTFVPGAVDAGHGEHWRNIPKRRACSRCAPIVSKMPGTKQIVCCLLLRPNSVKHGYTCKLHRHHGGPSPSHRQDQGSLGCSLQTHCQTPSLTHLADQYWESWETKLSAFPFSTL